MRESDLQKLVISHLHLSGLVWWRVPLGGVMQSGGKFRTSNPMAGFPDLCGLIPPTGKMWGIELKSTRGVISPIQKARIFELCGAGAMIRICRTFPEAKEFIDFIKSY